MQFKWRVLSFLTVILSISISCVIQDSFENKKYLNKITLAIILLASIISSVQFLIYENNHGRITDLNDLYNNMYSKEISLGGGKEYLPININYTDLTKPFEAKSNSRKYYKCRKRKF
ncbi:MAG: hypothetical protein HFJ45_05475 [Clostridia bacterium]|nr:hypothetical protein [Clostridia bacterium]